MRKANILVNGRLCGILTEYQKNKEYGFKYLAGYMGPVVSLTMPLSDQEYLFAGFPPFFDGLLPEGVQLDALLRLAKLDSNDYFGQLLVVGADLVGYVTVEPADEVTS